MTKPNLGLSELMLGVTYPNIPLFVDANSGSILVRLYNLNASYVFAKTRIICRDTGSNNKVDITVILSEKGNYYFEKTEGTPTGMKFYRDSAYLYALFTIHINATISYVGGSNSDPGIIGGVVMPSADVSGMTEVTVPQ